jgi:hypothetical protein
MRAPTFSGNGANQLILGNAFCVIRFLANAGLNSYRQYLDTGTVSGIPPGAGGILRTGFNATCGFLIQTGVTHTAIRMWFGLTNGDLHAVGTPVIGTDKHAIAAFRYDTTVDTGTTNWRSVTTAIDGGGKVSGVTVTDTGVDAAVNASPHLFIIQTSITAITFWIDDRVVARHTTNLPTDINLGHTCSVTTLDASNKRIEFGRAFVFHSEFGF